MPRLSRFLPLLVLALVISACARTPQVAIVAPPPVIVAAPLPMPAGAHPGMTIPARLADGGYVTPNRDLTPAATIWHLRAALNVAALACRGPAETTIIARYNALLRTQAPALAAAQTTLSSEYRAGGGDWQDRYDDEMTRLYNYFSQSFAREGFCAAAADALDATATLAPADLTIFATTRLAALDRPFTDFYYAYDAWRAAQGLRPLPAAFPAPVIAVAAPAAPAVAPAARPAPRLELDLSDLQD